MVYEVKHPKCQICMGLGEIYIGTYKLDPVTRQTFKYDKIICCPECNGTGKDLDVIE